MQYAVPILLTRMVTRWCHFSWNTTFNTDSSYCCNK